MTTDSRRHGGMIRVISFYRGCSTIREGSMNCSRCHNEISEGANYCPACGERQRAGGYANREARRGGRLMRSATDAKIAGVCGGIAEYLGADATFVRLVWAVLAIVPGCLL